MLERVLRSAERRHGHVVKVTLLAPVSPRSDTMNTFRKVLLNATVLLEAWASFM